MIRRAALPAVALLAWASAATAVTSVDLAAVAGESTVTLTAIGRKSGEPRAVTIWFVQDGERLFVQSGAGGQTDWYRNVLAHPEVTLAIGPLTLRGRAQPIDDPRETARVHALFEQKYLRARVFGWFGGETGHGKVVAIDRLERVPATP